METHTLQSKMKTHTLLHPIVFIKWVRRNLWPTTCICM